MNRSKKEAVYSLGVADVLQTARDREVKISPEVKDEVIVSWLQHHMAGFFEFAEERILNACVNTFREDGTP